LGLYVIIGVALLVVCGASYACGKYCWTAGHVYRSHNEHALIAVASTSAVVPTIRPSLPQTDGSISKQRSAGDNANGEFEMVATNNNSNRMRSL